MGSDVEKLAAENARRVAACERALLGGLMRAGADRDTILARVQPADFATDAHQALAAGLVALWAEREPVDLTTVADRLTKAGLMGRLGPDAGRAFEWLASLYADAPTVGTLDYHASEVLNASRTRMLLAAATEIVRECNPPSGSAAELIDRAVARMTALADRQDAGRRLKTSAEATNEVMDEYDRRSKGLVAAGVPTGLADLDEMLGGLGIGQMAILAARPSVGKAQPLDAMVLTPAGFVPMGSLSVGDQVIGSDGRPTAVVGVFPQGELPVYRVTFSDGASTRCCAEHLWFTQTKKERRHGAAGSVKSLAKIMATLHRDGSNPDHAVPCVAPVCYDQPAPLKLHPYVMGLLLGDGSVDDRVVRFSKPEADVQAQLAALLPADDRLTVAGDGKECRVRRAVRARDKTETYKAMAYYGLAGKPSTEKFIPLEYMRASPTDRLLLLRGLLDTDGSVTASGKSVEYGTSSPRLAEQVAELVRSLGGIVSVASRIPRYSYRGQSLAGAEAFRLVICMPAGVLPVSSAKHISKWRLEVIRRHRRKIVSVEPVGVAECQCIKVAAADSLYVTDDFIVTHNTALSTQIARHAAANGFPALVCSLEQEVKEVAGRGLAAIARVCGQSIRLGRPLRRDEMDRLASGVDVARGLTLWYDDTPSQSVLHVLSTARRLKRDCGLKLVVVDYLQLVEPEDGRASRNDQMDLIAKRCRHVARELDVAVLALSQLSRDCEKQNRRPRLSDLRDSGGIEQHADAVLMLHRPERSEGDVDPVELLVEKQRNGPTGIVNLAYRRKVLTFENAARGF